MQTYVDRVETDYKILLHGIRVGIYSRELAKASGFPEEDIQKTFMAGVLHDAGKLLVDKEILEKRGKLTYKEREEITDHPQNFVDLFNINVQINRNILHGIMFHHEREDGKGYYRRTKVNKIAKIIHITDVFDALTSPRVYRDNNQYSIEEAFRIMKEDKGSFNKKLLNRFEEMILNKHKAAIGLADIRSYLMT